MTSIVPNPLSRFRKHDNPRPLHARWGDVSITAPTEGSWCQYDNPHKSAQQRLGYGPGYVPDGFRRASESPSGDYEDENENEEEERKSSSRRMSTLKPRRLSMRLSRTKSPDAQQQQQQQRPRGIDRTEFEYKPIKQDYSSEVAEITHKRESRFRYIPASPQYLEELERSQSAGSGSSSYGPLSRSGSPLRYGVGVDDELHQGHDRGSRALPNSKRVLGACRSRAKGKGRVIQWWLTGRRDIRRGV